MEALRLPSSPLDHLEIGVWRQLRQASSPCYVLALFLEMGQGIGPVGDTSFFRGLAKELADCHVTDIAKRLAARCRRVPLDYRDYLGGADPDGRYKKLVSSIAAQAGFSLARQKKHTILKRVVDHEGTRHQQTLTAWKTPSNRQETKRLEARVRRMDDPERFDADKLRAMAARVGRSANGATVTSPIPPVAGRRARAKPRHRDFQRASTPDRAGQSADTFADVRDPGHQSSVCSDALQCLPTSHVLPSRVGAVPTSTRVLPKRRRRRNRWWNK